jgi:hypothetical protein
MKKIVFELAFLLMCLPFVLTACSNGPSQTKEYDFSNFTGVQVGGPFDVSITPSNSYSISITAPQDRFNNVKVEQSGSTLEVGMSFSFWSFWRNFGSKSKLEISMPELDNLNLSGATSGTVAGFTSNSNFQLELFGASNAEINIGAYDTSADLTGASHVSGVFNVHDLTLSVSGASNAELSGTGNNLNLQAAGASGADLGNLQVVDANVQLSGASHVTVDAASKLNITASGASNLSYVGNPSIGTVDVTGASSIHQK